MDYITVSAKNLDDAITEALIQLGVTSDNLDYIVIEKGSAGFLGIGFKQAVIKARRKVQEPEVEEVVFKEEPVKSESVKAESVENSKAVKSEKSSKPAKREKNDKHKKHDKHVKKEKPAAKEISKEISEEIVEKKETELAKVEEATIKACEKFIVDVLNAMNMGEVNVTSCIDEEGALSINMEGDNMGILIGKRGQTLDSLQYLANRVANKMQDGYVRVKLDTEDYRRRRKETLENLAKNIASKVKRTRRTVSLEPMNPYERRIIHSALQADPAVSTHSEGEEPYRRVVVTLVRHR